jgi:hypothetical protein
MKLTDITAGFTTTIVCDNTYALNCYNKYHFDILNGCIGECTALMNYTLWDEFYTIPTATGTAPMLFSDLGITASGLYHLVLQPTCSGVPCAGCTMHLDVSCSSTLAFMMYPNPTSDMLTVKAKDDQELISEIVIYDNTGNVVITRSYSEPLDIVTIDIAKYSGALYSVKVNGHYIERIIKE